MAFIYVITNDINNKQYVGKTNSSIEKRFREHIKDSKRERCEKRPLYDAMNKYGIEHFSIKLLEECDYKESSDREIYWIDKLNTYYNGYNATLGGDSKHYYDYKEISDKYLEFQHAGKTAQFFNCDLWTVREACKEFNIKIVSGKEKSKEVNGKQVVAYTKDGDKVKSFSDMSEAGKWLIEIGKAKGTIKTASSSIGKSLKNKTHKTAYGFIWKKDISEYKRSEQLAKS